MVKLFETPKKQLTKPQAHSPSLLSSKQFLLQTQTLIVEKSFEILDDKLVKCLII